MATWASGTQIGPYLLLAPIGAGGMGEVWKARDTRLDRIVALKRLKGQHTARFEQEARAIAALNHPNICVLYDIGPDYLVMEYIEGAPVQGPLPLEDALRLATQVAGALELAHSKGILHRDLKPGNILVAGSNAKLLDFGLAKLMSNSGSDVTQTVEGTVLGTAAYMSPEQAQGKPLDERSDVFSFGAVLHEMLSGQHAFGGASMLDVLNAVVRDEPAPLPSPAADVVKRCLAKQPAQRYQSMSDVKVALQQVTVKPVEQQPSIAVLPFANMSGDKEQEYFSDGLAEEIINALAQIPDLKVTSRTSAFAFRGKEQDITKIAEALKVRTILEGSVRKAGNRIRITAQLINAADGYHLWSQRYDADMTDVFAVQDEIATAIAAALRVKLAGGRDAIRRHNPSLASYEALLKGRHYLMRGTPEAHAQAQAYLEQAIRLDRDYAEPHAELGILYLILGAQSSRPAAEMMPLARMEATKAFALSADLPLAHVVLGAVASLLDRNWNEAGEQFRQAMSHEPVPVEVRGRYCAFYLIPLGRFREAKDQIDKVLDADPLHVLWRSLSALILAGMDRHEEAIAEARKALEINENHPVAHQWMSLSYACLGKLTEARASAGKVAGLPAPWNGIAPGLLAGILALSGDKKQADDLLKDTRPMGMVVYHLLCSDIEAAAEWYQKALEQHDLSAMLLNATSFLKPLRASSRWPALAKMMNLPEAIEPH
jgi:TolB-like protein/tRNA A-37 threonylcarbamoyl transferase component Bud32/Tfp pilus assembly protein PilF